MSSRILPPDLRLGLSDVIHLRDPLLKRSFHALGPAADLLLGAGSFVVELLPSDDWFRPSSGMQLARSSPDACRYRANDQVQYSVHRKPAVADIQLSTIRRWRISRLDSGVSAVTLAKAYRLLKAIMSTAMDDGLIKRNPCRIDGAGQEHSPERPVLTITQVFALADAFTDRRYRLLVLLAVFCSLRWDELAALTRDATDQEHGTISVRVGVVELAGGQLVTGPPKSAAGKRDVTIPAFLLPDVTAHLKDFTAANPRALVFTGGRGAQPRRSNFGRNWGKAMAAAGLSGVHFHDLRHTGNSLAVLSRDVGQPGDGR